MSNNTQTAKRDSLKNIRQAAANRKAKLEAEISKLAAEAAAKAEAGRLQEIKDMITEATEGTAEDDDTPLSAEDLAPYRNLFKADQKRDTTLTDAVLSELILSVETDLEGKEWISLMLAREQPNAPIITGQTLDDTRTPEQVAADAAKGEKGTVAGTTTVPAGKRWDPVAVAADVASKADKEMLSGLSFAIQAKEDADTKATLKVFGPMGRLYGKTIMGWPIAGSKHQETVDGKTITREVYDVFKREVLVDGEYKDKETSFYKELFQDMTVVSGPIMEAFRKLEGVKNNNPEQAGDYFGIDADQQKSIKKQMDKRLRNGVKALERAAMLYQRIEQINAMAHCGAQWLKTTDGELSQSPSPISVYNKDLERSPGTILSVTQVIGLDVEKALAKGGTHAELLKTGKRKPKTAGSSGDNIGDNFKTIVGVKMPVPNFVAGCAIMAHWADASTDDGQKRIADLLNAMAREQDEMAVKSVGDFCIAMDKVWDTIKDRYTRISQRLASEGHTADLTTTLKTVLSKVVAEKK